MRCGWQASVAIRAIRPRIPIAVAAARPLQPDEECRGRDQDFLAGGFAAAEPLPAFFAGFSAAAADAGALRLRPVDDLPAVRDFDARCFSSMSSARTMSSDRIPAALAIAIRASALFSSGLASSSSRITSRSAASALRLSTTSLLWRNSAISASTTGLIRAASMAMAVLPLQGRQCAAMASHRQRREAFRHRVGSAQGRRWKRAHIRLPLEDYFALIASAGSPPLASLPLALASSDA